MARNPMEQGALAAGNALEAMRRLGLTKDVVLDIFLYDRDCGGFRGARNAARNACLCGEIAEGEKAEYAMGWMVVLVLQIGSRL